MYEFAYSAICDDLPAHSALAPNSHSFSEAIELIDAADRVCQTSSQHLQLLSDLRRVWLKIAGGLLCEEQALSCESQEGLLRAVNRVLEEIERRRFGKASFRPRTDGAGPELLL